MYDNLILLSALILSEQTNLLDGLVQYGPVAIICGFLLYKDYKNDAFMQKTIDSLKESIDKLADSIDKKLK